MKKLLAALCAVWIAFVPNIALAQIPAAAKTEGQSQSNGGIYTGVGYWDGASWHAGRADANGILRVTDEYPSTSQYSSPTVATNATVMWCKFTTLQPLGSAVTAYPYGYKTLTLVKTTTGNSPSTALVYVFTSEDGATFRPLMVPTGGEKTFADTTKSDTLKVLMRYGTSGATISQTFNIADDIYLGRYVQLFATKNDTVASATVTVSAAWGQRER